MMVTGLKDEIISMDEYISLPIEEKINFRGKIKVTCPRCHLEFIDGNKNLYNFDTVVCPFCRETIYYTEKRRRKSILNCSLNQQEVLYYLKSRNPDMIEAELYLNIKDKYLLLEILRFVDGKCEGHINLIM